MRRELEALQEENVHLQSECERLSREAAEPQRLSAGSGNAEMDAGRDWRIHSHDRLQQQVSGTSSVDVVTEGFVLPHDVEQLQERILELVRENRVLRSAHQRIGHSPTASVTGSDLDISEGGFFLSSSAREDAEISPVPSPDPSICAESHSPAYERLKFDFGAYKQKAQKAYAKLKARLVSTVREYNELKSSCALGISPSTSPVLWSSVSPVADILASQSKLREQMSPVDGRFSTSSWHCRDREVQTDLCDITRNIDVLDAGVVDIRTFEKTVESEPSEVVQDAQIGSENKEIDSASSAGDRYTALEMELLDLRTQCSALKQQNASLTELVGSIRDDAEKRERPGVTEPSITDTPAAAEMDVSTAADANSNYRNLITENQRLREERKVDQSEYEERLRELEERCMEENARLKQLLSAVKAGSERSEEVGGGDLSSSCRHCAELAEKCRVLETSAELSSINAERRLRAAEESRNVATRLQSRLDQLSGDDRNMVSETHAGSDNSLFSYVVDSDIVSNTSVADRQDIIGGGLVVIRTVSGTNLVALPSVDHDLVQPPFYSPGNDVDLEVAEIFAPKHEVTTYNVMNSDLKSCESVDDGDLSSSFFSCEDLSDADGKMSHGFQHLGEFNGAFSTQVHYETTPGHDSCWPAFTGAHLAESETERTEIFPGALDQHFVAESDKVIPVESECQQYGITETAAGQHKPQKTASLSEKRTKTFPVSFTKSSGRKSFGGSIPKAPSVKNVNCSSLGKQPCTLLSPDTVNSDNRNSHTTSTQIRVEEATAEMPIVGVKQQDQAAVDKEDTVISCSPSGTTSSAAMMENVTRLVSQNEEMLRRNRAWTDKLKREYAVAADELRSMKNKYENVVSEKEKVRAHLQLAHQDIKPGGSRDVKQSVADRKATVKREAKIPLSKQQQKDMSVHTAANVSSSEIAEVKLQYEILLNEKSELCRKFEAERLELLKKLEGRDSDPVAKSEVRMLQDADIGCGGRTVCESEAEAVLVDSSQSNVTCLSSCQHVSLHVDDAVKQLGQSLESEDVAAGAATVSEVMPSASSIDIAPLFNVGVEHVPSSAIDSSCHYEVGTTVSQSIANSSIIPRSNDDTVDESHAVKLHSMCNDLQTTLIDASSELSSTVHVELELLRLEKRELCTSLELEEQKCAELQQQRSELACNTELLEVRSNELEEQLNSAKIQLEIDLEEKRELCQRCAELSAKLEAAGITQTECGDITQDQDNYVEADGISAAVESIEAVSNNSADTTLSDTTLSVQPDSRQLAVKVLELTVELDRTTAEKLAFQDRLERSEEERQFLAQNVEQLTGQLDCATKSSEDALHAAVSEMQDLTTANSSLEITNSSLTNDIEELKSHCCSLQDDASRLSDEVRSLQLELESTNHAKQLISQRCDELLSDVNSARQSVACLEEENADFWAKLQSVNEKNERLLVEIADFGRDCELLSKEKENLAAENSAAESAKCLLEEQCSKLREKLQLLETNAAEMRLQHESDLQNVRSALDCKEKECIMFSEELESAKLSVELNVLKLHDSLKCNAEQLQQLVNAESIIKDLEGKLREKQTELQSATDLHASAVSAVDEATSRLVLLQSENETVSAALSELRAEKDELVTESETRVEALEADLLRKSDEISSLQEKVVQIEAANEQLLNELQSVNTTLHETENELQSVNTALYESQNELQSVNTTLHETDNELQSVRTALHETQNELQSVNTTLRETQKDLQSVNTVFRETQKELQSVNTTLCETQNELQSVNTSLHETQHQLHEEKLHHEQQMSAFKEQLEDECASVKVVCDNQSAELENVTMKCTSVELELSAVKTESTGIREELDQAREEVQKQQDLLNTLSGEYQQCKDDAETQLAEVKSVRDGLADSLAECRQQKKAVEERLDQLASEFDSCKVEMAAVIEEIVVFKQCNDELKLRIAQSQNNEENLAEELRKLRAEHTESCALHRMEMEEQKQMVLRAEKERDELRSIHEQSCQVIDETITKYSEVEAQLSQLRQTNNMLMCDLDKSNQRCNDVSGENERLLSDNRELADSLSSKSTQIGLLEVENQAAEGKIVELSSELKSFDEKLTELVSKESALQEEAAELKSANAQLHQELEQIRQLSQELDDSRKHTIKIESELDEMKATHRMLLDREEMLVEEVGVLTASRDELLSSFQSDSQMRQRECECLKSQIAEMEAELGAARDNVSSLQTQKQDVDNICKLLHDCIANCILEALKDETAQDTEVEAEGRVINEILENDDVEQLNWLQVQIGRQNDQLQSFRDELKACHESLSLEESLRTTDRKLMEKLEEECKRLEDELAARNRQLDESNEQHASAVSALYSQQDGLKRENERLLEDHEVMSDLQSSSQQNISVLADEITALKLTMQQLEETNAETERCWKTRDSEFNQLTEDYNVVITEKSALEKVNRSLSDQVETLQKEHLELLTELKSESASNVALKEKLSRATVELQQSIQACSAHCVKVSELEGRLLSQDCRNEKLADSVDKYKTLFDEISHAVAAISLKCRSDYPDVASADKVDTSCSECADKVLQPYSHLLPSLDILSNCYKQLSEEQNQQREKMSTLVAECDFMRAQASVDMNVDESLQELQDEVARLFQSKTDLENEVMHLRAENGEAKDAYDRREAELAAQRESRDQKIADLHHLLDMASQSKEALETELLCERNEFERNLAAARCESLLRAGRSEEEQRKIVEQLSDAESQLAGLRDRLRASQDERDLLQLRLAYVTRECTVKEQHVDDLRAQVAAQHAHIEEAMTEHRNTIQLLVELRLEQQLGRREQHGEFSRLEEEILRLESHIESCSSRVGTPQTMSLLNAPVSHKPSSVHSLPVDSTCQTDQDTAVTSDHDQTLQPSPADLAYKALETKHFQLVQELSELKQQLLDVQETNKCLSDENVVLKHHVEESKTPDSSVPGSTSLCNVHEHESSMDFPRRPYRVQSCEQFSSIGSSTSLASVDQRVVGLNVPVEMVGLQAKLVRLQKDYQKLVSENGELRTSLLAKQDELMKQMESVREKQKKRPFRFGSSYSLENVAAVTELSGQQIQLLQKERDELRCRLDATKVEEDEAAKLSDRVEQLEDALSKERQKFHELYQEKESIEIELLREQLTVEKHVREFQHLQGLVSKKDRLEQQLHKTSSSTIPDSTSSSGTRQILQEKKTQLVVEIRRKILYRDVAVQVGDSGLRSIRRTQAMSVQPVMKRPAPIAAERSLRLDCGCLTELGTMRMRAGCRYHQAVERLRRELKAQDAAARKSSKHAAIR